MLLASAVESELRAAARKALEVLAARFDETAVIAVRDRDEIVALDEVAPEHRIVTVRYSAGVRHPVGVGAHGVVLSDSPSAGRRPYVVTRGELEPASPG